MTPFQREKVLAGFKASLARERKNLERDTALVRFVDSETLKLQIELHRFNIKLYEKLIAEWECK